MPNLVKIGLTVQELYKFFCKFQDGSRRPSWITNFAISGYGPVAGATVMVCIKFGPDRFTVQKLLRFFSPIGNALRVPQNWGFGGF